MDDLVDPREIGRNLVAENRFIREGEAIEADTARFDEMLESFNQIIPSRPERGKPTANPRILGYPVRNHAGQRFVIYYTYDDRAVRLLSIR